ncbi:Ti-type conjugative transfer relaxase TraA [Sphingobium cloacae]|uniref:Conjugal transfer relaxase TraA n=1 Tax=Sphingobium cloacae TaxID=120107 RepID=A0A1E1F1S6_9SPHN|nr:Ti-type conjugative transfer relaxase TraA [Sphingobium cloacae]BAV64475.1 conjugal transfer relaxase TraA [Sphingobium cloacae]
MAIYHFSAQIIGRKMGRSAVAAAAYRSGERLHDERLDRDHDYRAKGGVVHSEVMLSDGASEEWSDRERLWNDVEAAELRKDAQLAREIEVAIPVEMNQREGTELVRDFVQAEFVDHGMVADVNVHWDNPANPHAHVMLTMREATLDENGDPAFGAKVREWNDKALLERWRERWASHVNERLAELDIDARVDHRSLEAQGIALEPQHEIGGPAQRMERDGLLADRAEEHREIAHANGAKIIANPDLALDAMTQQQSTFTNRDFAKFAHRHSDGLDQFNAVMSAVKGCDNLVELGQDRFGNDRFTSRSMIEAEQAMHRAAQAMAERERHGVDDRDREAALAQSERTGLTLSAEQRDAFAHVTEGHDLSLVVGYAGTGKSAMLGVAREAWEAAGYEVRGVALSGIAAENLQSGSGITSRTIASMEHGWAQGRDLLASRNVLVIDEAGMVGTRQMERVLGHAASVGAKVVLVGDPQQLQSIEAGAAFRSLHDRHGGVEITEVRRQHEQWQRDATRDLATGETRAAIHAYAGHGMVHEAATRESARDELVDRWDEDRLANPDKSRIIFTHTNAEVRELSDLTRTRMRESGALGEEVSIQVERGTRSFAPGDRLVFLRNDRNLGVKNGTLGTVEQVGREAMTVRLDAGRSVSFELKDFAHVDHGYAATIHKAQGMTVDRAHVLATPGMDAHGSYVSLSRHRDSVQLHYGRDDFADRDRLVRTLSRDRSKDMAFDYARGDPARDYAERRGLTFRERVVEIVRKVVPEKVCDLFDGLRPSERGGPAVPAALGPEREGKLDGKPQVQRDSERATPARGSADPEAALRRQRTLALRRHAQAVDAVFKAEDAGGKPSTEQMRELTDSRKAFEEVRPFGWRDAEAAYAKNPALPTEAAGGRFQRAVTALELETEIRTNPELRADRFVERWQKLETKSATQYQGSDISGYRATRRAMGEMAFKLERDPQLESVLANRKTALGVAMDSQRSIGRELCFKHGIDYGIGRGISIGM